MWEPGQQRRRHHHAATWHKTPDAEQRDVLTSHPGKPATKHTVSLVVLEASVHVMMHALLQLSRKHIASRDSYDTEAAILGSGQARECRGGRWIVTQVSGVGVNRRPSHSSSGQSGGSRQGRAAGINRMRTAQPCGGRW